MGYWPSVRSKWLDIGQVRFLRAWSIKDLLYGFRGNFSCGTRRVVPSGQDGSGSQSQRRIWFILPAHGVGHIIKTISAVNRLELETKSCSGTKRGKIYDWCKMRKTWSPANRSQHIATLLGATCCVRLATVLWQVWNWLNLSQQYLTCRNTVAKRTQHVAPNNVAICCDRLAGCQACANM